MNIFENVNVNKLANIYFEGNVISRNISFIDGTIKTLGVMLPGNYEFKTEKREFMEILSGEMEFQLKESQNWETIKDGMSFYVPKNSSFKVKIRKLVNYCCSYLNK